MQEKIEFSTDVLKEIIKPALDEVEEIHWPPREPETLKLMEKVKLFSCSFFFSRICFDTELMNEYMQSIK